jgi:hypothetical protein
MKQFVPARAEEFLKLQSSHFLELIAVPKRKISTGIDCEPWSQSDPFCFTQHPRDGATSVLILAGFPIQLIYERNESTSLEVCIKEIH